MTVDRLNSAQITKKKTHWLNQIIEMIDVDGALSPTLPPLFSSSSISYRVCSISSFSLLCRHLGDNPNPSTSRPSVNSHRKGKTETKNETVAIITETTKMVTTRDQDTENTVSR